MAEIDQEFVEYIVKALVATPEAVSVKRSVDSEGVLLELTVDQADTGKVIGRAGATAKAIRKLLGVLGAKQDQRISLKIVEPDRPEGARTPEASNEPEEAQEPVSEVEESTGESTSSREQLKKEVAELADLDL